MTRIDHTNIKSGGAELTDVIRVFRVAIKQTFFFHPIVS